MPGIDVGRMPRTVSGTHPLVRRALRVVPALVIVLLPLAACGQTGNGAAPSATTSTTKEPTTTSTVSTTPGISSPTVTTGSGRRFPPEADNLRTGERAFGVYVAVERDSAAPELARAEEDLRRVGYSPGPGAPDINCDHGAREALGLTPGVDYFSVAVYFRTRHEAQQFVDAFEPGVVGTAEVTVDCRH